MIAVDTNILVHAHRRDSPLHAPAYHQLKALAEGRATWAIPWPCVHEFAAVVTRASLWNRPSTTRDVAAQLHAWIAAPTMHCLGETDRHLDLLLDLLHEGAVTGAAVHDARVAAICLGHGVRELWTADRDFTRFPRLKTRNPLVGHRGDT